MNIPIDRLADLIGVENTASMLHHTGFFLILFGSLYPTAKHTHTHTCPSKQQEPGKSWNQKRRRRKKKSEAPPESYSSLISFVS